MAIPSTKEIKFWLFMAVFIIVIIMLARLLIPFIAPLILAAIIVSIFTPVYYLLHRWLPQGVSSFICCGLICVVIFIPFVIVITILANQALTLYSNAMNSEFMQNLISEIDGNFVVNKLNEILIKLNIGFTISGDDIYQLISRFGSRFGTFLYTQAAGITGNLIRLVINFCFMILIAFYLFGNGRRVIKFFMALSPLPEGHEEAMLRRLKTTAGSIFLGSGLSGLIQGTVGGLTLWYFGFPAPFLWAVVMVILAFLPIVGISLVFVPCIAITFVGGHYVDGVIMAIIYISASSITEYIIVPRFEGKQSQMNTVLVFLSVLGGLQLFGMIGILYGPLIITAFLAFYEIFRANYAEISPVQTTTSGVVVGGGFNCEKANVSAFGTIEPKLRGIRNAEYKPGLVPEEIEDVDNVALGDDIEPEFNVATGEPLHEAAPVEMVKPDYESAFGEVEPVPAIKEPPNDNIALGDDVEPEYDAGDGALADCTDIEDGESDEDGLIWDEQRPAHLPFPEAEGAERLMAEKDPGVSIQDIVKQDISSFKNIDESIVKKDTEDDSSSDKTKE